MRRLPWALLLAVTIISAMNVQAREPSFVVDVQGEGPPMLLIPGLNSAGAVWDDLTPNFNKKYQTHTLTIKGFAGVPLSEKPSLFAVKNDIIAYINEQQLKAPILIGHSLGGFLSMWVASEAPESVGPLVVVDSLPFFSLVFNPMATEESMAPMARQQTQGIAQASASERLQYYQQNTPGLVSDPDDIQTVIGWSLASDPAMTAEAMYTMLTTDLRDDIARIKTPMLLLGSWYSAKNFGGTIDTTRQLYAEQYKKLPNLKMAIHESAKHFIMLDDSGWTGRKIESFLPQ